MLRAKKMLHIAASENFWNRSPQNDSGSRCGRKQQTPTRDGRESSLVHLVYVGALSLASEMGSLDESLARVQFSKLQRRIDGVHSGWTDPCLILYA